MSKHAFLSPSGSHRWLNCTPSAMLESEFPGGSSSAAEEGTAAHAFCEHKLKKALRRRSKRPVSDYDSDEMQEYTDSYVDYVLEQLEVAKQTCKDPMVLIEQKVDFSEYVPDGYGTADCIVVSDDTMQIIDFKYGLGVLVDAEQNTQLMCYSIGALNLFDSLYDIKNVTMHIFQPRRENVQSWTIPVDELKAWAENELKPKAQMALNGEGEYYPGEWCQFCKAAVRCRARAEEKLRLAQQEFKMPPLLTDSEIEEVLTILPDLTKWADGILAYDIYIGKLFHDYVRTGAIGWVVWGICYAILQMGTFCDEKHGFKKMLMKAGEWILSRQITDTKDPRYGLLRGGYGAYDSEYRYSDVEIEWCSTEHQCSTLQALEGLSLVLNDKKYKEAAELVRDQLFLKCYDESNGRFYQGINGGKPDKAWALDCTTWAGSLIFSVVHTDTAKKCFHTARDVYLTENKQIIQSSDKEHYNMRYSSSEQFAGFKPYSDKTPDYEGAPDIVWTEGTLGYAALALCVGEEKEAKKYVDECIALQNCEGCTGGVIYVTETYASLPWEFHVWESVVSSAWLYLIINNPDVLFPRTLRQVYYMVKTYNIKDERP